MKKAIFLSVLASALLFCGPLAGQEKNTSRTMAAEKSVKVPGIEIACTPATHVAKLGEQVKFAITSNSEAPVEVTVSLDGSDSKVFKKVTVTTPAEVTASLDYPGFLHCVAKSGRTTVRQAVAVAPEKLRYARKAPADFDKFWEEAFKESAKLPLDLKMEPVNPNADYDSWLLSCANVNGKRAYAFFSRPKNVKGKIPLLVFFGGGEAYVSSAVVPGSAIKAAGRFNQPMAVLYFHLPPYRPPATWAEVRTKHKAFLKELNLRRYILIGMDSARTFYAYSGILGCMRLLNAVVERPEIDGKKLLFHGASHGGKFGAFLTAFYPFKAAFLGVPSSCEINAAQEGRYGSAAKEWIPYPKTTDYYDLVYFAPKIKCDVLVTAGYVDRSCPPTGVYSFYNTIPEGRKKFFAKIKNGHGDNPDGYVAMSWQFLIDRLNDKK